MIIVEGTDLTGKTTLAKRLAERLASDGYVYSHFTRLPSGFDYCGDYIARASRRIVQDRFHFSEWCYSAARGERESPLSAEKYRVVDGALRLLGAFTVVVITDPALLQERYEANKDREMFSLDVILRAQVTFEFHVETRSVDYDMVIRCDADHPWPSAQHDCDLILTAYNRRQNEHFSIRERGRNRFEEVL